MSNPLRHPYDSGYIYFPGVLSSFRQSEAIAAAPPRYFTGALPQGYAAELGSGGQDPFRPLAVAGADAAE